MWVIHANLSRKDHIFELRNVIHHYSFSSIFFQEIWQYTGEWTLYITQLILKYTQNKILVSDSLFWSYCLQLEIFSEVITADPYRFIRTFSWLFACILYYVENDFFIFESIGHKLYFFRRRIHRLIVTAMKVIYKQKKLEGEYIETSLMNQMNINR